MSLQQKLHSLPIDPRGLVLPLLFLAVWQSVTALHWVDTRIIVPPSAVLAVGWQWLSNGQLFSGLGASLLRDASGFILGSVAGVAIGVLLGISEGTSKSNLAKARAKMQEKIIQLNKVNVSVYEK